MSNPLGVSVVICCHNSAQLLPPTLEHLKAQRTPRNLRWEIIVIDNASTDHTASTARACWSSEYPAPLRVVSEPQLGLAHARERGFREAEYEIVAFVDDDNWVSDGWIAAVSDAITSDPRIGGVGSLIYPQFESAPPPWWCEIRVSLYALRFEPAERTGSLIGAGMAIRKAAWRQLIECGFRWRLIDHKGKSLSTCGDTETSCALRLLGWQLRIDDRMRLLHYLPAKRLTWRYYRRLLRAFEASHLLIDTYYASADGMTLPCTLERPWQLLLLRNLARSLRHPVRLYKWLFSGREGDRDVLEQERDVGRMLGLLNFRSRYTDLVKRVRAGQSILESRSNEPRRLRALSRALTRTSSND
jgi:glycosyltransferase involved in cell wall biosynthesis